MRIAIACFAFGAVACAALAQDNPASRYQVLSGPDCAGAGNIIAEEAVEPRNATFMRVQHMGDPGTRELLEETAHEVTWDVGAMTGLRTDTSAQRGYRDVPPPVAASAFQLECGNAGFLVNSFEFGHSQPIAGAGQSAGVNRSIDPAPAFADSRSTLLLQARIAVPTAYSPNLQPDLGVGSVSFYYYMQDTKSGIFIAHVIGVFDNRPVGMAGAGDEFLGNDGVTAFAGSPLAALDSHGDPVRFVETSPYSEPMHRGDTFADPRLFRAEITYARFKALLEALKPQAPAMSTEPLDYRVVFFGVLGEIFVGTQRGHDVMLGASVRSLTLARVGADRRFRH